MFRLSTIKKRVLITLSICIWQLSSYAQEAAVQPKNYYTSNFIIDEKPRDISFYIPAGYGNNDTYPLLLVLHDENETAKATIKKYGDYLERLADSTNCVVVFPDAFNGHWNSKIGAQAGKDTVNDVGFITIMIDYFVQQYKCDADRVFVTGFSSGGQMAWRAGCDIPKKVVAIAPFVASITEIQKSCTLTMPYFDGSKYMQPTAKKLSYSAISAALNFLLQHSKTP